LRLISQSQSRIQVLCRSRQRPDLLEHALRQHRIEIPHPQPRAREFLQKLLDALRSKCAADRSLQLAKFFFFLDLDRCLFECHLLQFLERETGIEPATNSLEGCDSTTGLLPPKTVVGRRSLVVRQNQHSTTPTTNSGADDQD